MPILNLTKRFLVQDIRIRGARTHNLKGIDLDLPRNKLVVITGLSGSGKSSLAFDTLYAEGQRRYVESLSAYARQFLELMEKPDVDQIEGLSPAISIEQKSVSHNPRSTVGTITEIHDYLRLLYARAGEPRCPAHNTVLAAQTISQMVDAVLALPQDSKIMLLAPIVQNRKGEQQQALQSLRSQGFVRVRIDGEIQELDQIDKLDGKKKHSIDVVVDRLKVRPDLQLRLAESFATALRLSDGLACISSMQDEKEGGMPDQIFSARFACAICGYSMAALEPRLFSFNNPVGACSGCDGLGTKQVFDHNKVIHDTSVSLAAGAIRGWDKKNVYYSSVLSSIAAHYNFDINTVFSDLPSKIQNIILWGSGREVIAFDYASGLGARGKKTKRKHKFEGVIPNMERRYRETESSVIREELAKYLSQNACPECNGERLCISARHVFVASKNLPEITAMSIDKALHFFENLNLPGRFAEISSPIIREISSRLQFLISVGLNYLSLERKAETLSGGEAQRIRLASQIGSGLVGVMYVLDEPSIGLHQRDNQRLLGTLQKLRDLGNTVIVVEHDEEAILGADYVVDIGPGAGVHGGHVVAQGTPSAIMQNPKSLTGQYLSGALAIEIPQKRLPYDSKRVLRLQGATCNNLQKVDINIPIGLMTCVTGVSGSGKSSLVNDTLYPLVAKHLNGTVSLSIGHYDNIAGLGFLDKVVDIDQSPIGRTPRSNPATYTGLFTPIRELFAATQESRSRGYRSGRFSFNVPGGRCETCQGDGLIKVEMHFLADIYVTCDVCKGKRYSRETLDILYKGKSIHQVLDMTVEEARDFFEAFPLLVRKLQTLIEVGLPYIRLGQSATTLSGGEAQRVKLAKELSKRATGNTLFILDEPTTGLHFHDVKQLLVVLHRLRDQGNTILVIEHNLDVIKTADWLIDMGPEGGSGGGQVVATGTPEEVSQHKTSYTGLFLKQILEKQILEELSADVKNT